MSIHLLFDPRDLWIGVYWNVESDGWSALRHEVYIYICIIPTLPLRIRWWTSS